MRLRDKVAIVSGAASGIGRVSARLFAAGVPEDIARVALFLAGDESGFVTGAAYNADGGWTAGLAKAVALV